MAIPGAARPYITRKRESADCTLPVACRLTTVDDSAYYSAYYSLGGGCVSLIQNPRCSDLVLFCGAEGNRTPDPFHAMEVLYQLSYSPGN